MISTNYDDFDNADFDTEYVMEGLEKIIYKYSKDTLCIYTTKEFKSPENFDSKIEVKQVVLDNSQFVDLVEEAQNNLIIF